MMKTITICFPCTALSFIMRVMFPAGLVFMHPAPVHGCDASFTYSINGSTVTFTNTSQSSGTFSSSWTFGDGSYGNEPDPVHVYNSMGPYVVCLEITDTVAGCTDIHCDSIYLWQNCNALFSYQVNDLEVTFTNNSYGSYAQWNWDFGDFSSSSDNDPVHVYSSSGTYTACLNIWDSLSCNSQYCQAILAGIPPCNAYFILVPDSAQPGLYWGYNLSSGTSLIYTWYWGDGTSSTGQYPSHTYSDSGFYEICLTIQDNAGCADSFCMEYYIQKTTEMQGLFEVIFIPEVTSGFPELFTMDFTVFPNPAENRITLEADPLFAGDVSIELLTPAGHNLWLKSVRFEALSGGIELDIWQVPPGLYLLRLQTENGYHVKKLIIMK